MHWRPQTERKADMDKIRIYAVAQELGIPAKELLAYFEEGGTSYSSHLALVDTAAADRARAHFAVQNGPEAATALSPSPASRKPEAALDFVPFQTEAPAKPGDSGAAAVVQAVEREAFLLHDRVEDHAEIDLIDEDMHMPLGLHRAAHHPERQPRRALDKLFSKTPAEFH